MFVEQIPSHPEYKLLTQEEKNSCNSVCLFNFSLT